MGSTPGFRSICRRKPSMSLRSAMPATLCMRRPASSFPDTTVRDPRDGRSVTITAGGGGSHLDPTLAGAPYRCARPVYGRRQARRREHMPGRREIERAMDAHELRSDRCLAFAASGPLGRRDAVVFGAAWQRCRLLCSGSTQSYGRGPDLRAVVGAAIGCRMPTQCAPCPYRFVAVAAPASPSPSAGSAFSFLAGERLA